MYTHVRAHARTHAHTYIHTDLYMHLRAHIHMLSDTKKHKHLMVFLDLLLMKIMQMTNIVLLVTE